MLYFDSAPMPQVLSRLYNLASRPPPAHPYSRQKIRLTSRVQGMQTGAWGKAHASGGIKQPEAKRPCTESRPQRQQQPSGAAGSPKTRAISSKGHHMAVNLREGGGKEGEPSREARGGAAPTAKLAQPAHAEIKCSVEDSARKLAHDGGGASDSAGGNATGMATTSHHLAAAPSTSRREEEEVVPPPTPAAALSAGPVAAAAEEKQEGALVCDGSVSRGPELLHRQLPRTVGGS